MIRATVLTVALAAVGAPPALPADARPVATTPPIQIRVVEPGGFHWQDAAVGSLATLGLALVGVGVVATRRTNAEPSRTKPDRNR